MQNGWVLTHNSIDCQENMTLFLTNKKEYGNDAYEEKTTLP